MTEEQYNHIVTLLTEIRVNLPSPKPECKHVWGVSPEYGASSSAVCIKCGFKP